MTLRLPPTPTEERQNEVYPTGTLVLDASTFELWIGDGFTPGGTKPVAIDDTPSGGVTDHGALTGLSDDDHTQYATNDDSKARAGDIDMGGHSLVDCGTVNCSQGIVTATPTLGGHFWRKSDQDSYVPALDYVKVQGASGQDMNAAASNNLMAWATELENEGSTFTWATGDNSKLTVASACHALVIVNVVLTSAGARQASYMKVKLNGSTDLSERAATGYIRNLNSHTRASYHLVFPYSFSASDYIQVYFDRASDVTTAATTQGTQNSFSLVRIR